MESILLRTPENYSANINGFRGFCVALIFLHHVANSGLPPQASPDSMWQIGLHQLFMSFAYGVELFFMISGYVIVKSLRRHATIPGFLRDRVLRIFPVWVPIALFLCAAGALSGRPGIDGVGPAQWLVLAVANVFLLPPLIPMFVAHPASWSLSYEWLFYLAGALAAWMWRRGGTPAVAKLLWAVAVALLIACFPRGLYFLPGVLIALVFEPAGVLRPRAWLACLTLPLFLFAWFSTGISAAEYDKPIWTAVLEGHGPAIVVAFMAATCLFASVASPAAAGLSVLGSRFLQHLGTLSFSFYLIHPIVMSVVKKSVYRWVPDSQGSWAATLIFAISSGLLAWGLSYLSWRWLEQGFARWLKSRTGADARRSAELGGQARLT